MIFRHEKIAILQQFTRRNGQFTIQIPPSAPENLEIVELQRFRGFLFPKIPLEIIYSILRKSPEIRSIGSMCRNEEQLRASVKGSKEEQKLDTTEEFKRAVIDDLDKVDELQKEAARLQHEALKIYKKVVLKNIDYG